MRYSPFSRGAIQRKDGPASAVFVGDMNEQRVSVVLDSNTVRGIALFFEPARDATAAG